MMSDRIRIRDGSLISTTRTSASVPTEQLHGEASGFDVTPELMKEQGFDIRLVIDDEYKRSI